VAPKRGVNGRPRQLAPVPARRERLIDDAEHLAIDAATGNVPAAVADGVKTLFDLVGAERSSNARRPGTVVNSRASRYPPATATRLAVETNPGPPKGSRRKRNVLSLPPGRAKRAIRSVLRSAPRRSQTNNNQMNGRLFYTAGASRAPQSANRRTRLRFVSTSDDSITLTGHDFMATVSVNTNMEPGDRILVADVHPLAIAGSTRLSRIASAFETYLYTKYHATVITTADTTVKANYTLHFDKDSGDALIPETGGGVQAKSQAIGHNGIIHKAFENSELSMPLHNQQKEYFVQGNGSDARLTRQARFYILASTAPSHAFDMDVWINWTCRLRLPALDGPSVDGSGPLSTVYCDTATATAINPLGTAAPSSASQIAAGIGVGYNGSDSYVYWKTGYKVPAEFSFLCQLAGAATASWSHSSSSNLAAVPGSINGNTVASGKTADYHTLRYSGGTTSLALTAARFWNGSQWISEASPSTLSVYWYMYMHLGTFTTPSSVVFTIQELHYLGGSMVKHATRKVESVETKTQWARDMLPSDDEVDYRSLPRQDDEKSVKSLPRRSLK